jgi:NAD(P)-dependent dehydrogenase (short-subunit alcohol dehydrogenase family)
MARTFDAAALAGRAGAVTGAASGIGRATVLALVAAGADVLVADVDAAGGEETVALAEGPGRASFFAADPNLRGLIEAGHPIGRLGRSEEIADTVVWLVSDASSFVTGQPILVDGGYTAQ